jgi:tetratricopeptide (TPR) repeat protein
MSMKLFPKPAQTQSDTADDRDVARLVQRGTVCYEGKLAWLTHEEFVEAVVTRGGQYGQITDCGVMVVGEGDWPLADETRLDKKLRTLERLEKRADAGVCVVGEQQFLEALGLESHRENARQLFSTARLTELLEISRDTIRAWVRAGLIRPAKTELGVWYFDFRDVSTARTLVELTAAGVSIERIRRTLNKVRKWMPDVEHPLQQLAVLEKNGPALVRLAHGELAEPEGQLHFEFGSSPQGLTESGAGVSSLRIAPGPRTAAEWLEQGLAQEREGYFEEAAASYREALLIGGPDAVTCFNLANALRALGHKAQALERYSQAVEVEPDFALAWNNLGTLLSELGRRDDACSAFRRALAADSDDAQAHYNLADTLDELGRTSEAEPHWRAYLKYDPTSQWGKHARQRLAERAS